jgi:hypothetical protein
MPSYIIRVSDLSGIAVDANVFLPSPSMGASSSDPNSKWWASGLLAVTAGRCVLYTDPSLFNQVSTSTIPLDGGASTGLDDGSSGNSQDVSSGGSQDVSSGGSGDPTSLFTPKTLGLCRPDPPYYVGVKLYSFYGVASTYSSGGGFLYQGWTIPGGLAAGQVTWVLTSTS